MNTLYDERITTVPQVQAQASPTRTAVPNLRHVPLGQLADLAESMLRRIVPAADAVKAPVAAFDASL